MNKGPQIKTLAKYIDYIAEVMKANKLEAPFYNVNWKNNEILCNYFGSKVNNRQYKYFIDKMLEMGILLNEEDFFVPKLKARYYSLNVAKLKSILTGQNRLLDLVHNHVYLLDKLSPVKTSADSTLDEIISQSVSSLSSNINHLSSSSIIIPPLNSYKVELKRDNVDMAKWFNQIDKADILEMKKLHFSSKVGFTTKQKQILADYYRARLLENPIHLRLVSEIQKFNSNNPSEDIQIHFNLNVHYGKGTFRFTLSPGGRQYNQLGQRRKSLRYQVLKNDGFDSEWDIPGAIYSVTRALNKGIFNTEWDIKSEVFEDYPTLTKEQKASAKTILMRLYFESSVAKVTANYNRSFDKLFPIDRKSFEEMYKILIDNIGETTRYQHSIFMYESLLEVMAMNRLNEKGYEVRNAFDCFYFKSSQTSEDEVKKTVCECMYDITILNEDLLNGNKV